MIGLVIPVTTLAASIIVLMILYKVTKIFPYQAFLIGAGLLILTLVIQPPIQQIPVVLLKINPSTVSINILIPVLLYAALVSGFLQELLKLLGVRGKSIEYALWLGAGFGFGEASLVALNQFINVWIGVDTPLCLGLVSCFERFTALLYHMFSAALLYQYYSRGRGLTIYIIMALIHSLMNYQAVLFIRLYGLSAPALLTIYSIVSGIVLSLYIIYRREMRSSG